MKLNSAQAAMVMRRHGLQRVHVLPTLRGKGPLAIFFERAQVRHCWLVATGSDADAFDQVVARQFNSCATSPPPWP